MRKSFLALMLAATLPAVAAAQSVEVVARSAHGDTSRTDIAARVVLPMITAEVGHVDSPESSETYLAGTWSASIWRVTFGAEAQMTPNAYWMARSSGGGSLGIKLTKNLSNTVRAIQYRNPDKTRQTLITEGLDYVAGPLTVGGTVGHIQGYGKATSYLRVNHVSKIDNTTIYVANNAETPDVPWSVWFQKEVGVTERLTLSKHYTLIFGTSRGIVGSEKRNYSAYTVGSRYNF